jgi:DNA-directed RNA polymerase I, II, and III subunit RPABC5
MIIPVKCFTCGKVLANMYRYFITEVRKIKSMISSSNIEVDNVIYLTKIQTDKTPEGEVLDRLHVNKICCRRHMLTHVDIE